MFLRLTTLLTSTPWFITSDAYDGLATLFGRLVSQPEEAFGKLTADEFMVPALAASGVDANGVGHFVADGILAPRLSAIDQKCGGVDTAAAPKAIEKMIGDGAKAVMFHVNSPGGNGGMLPELANYIANLSVPTASYTYGREASAATWAFAGVGLKGATPSAVMGSIGGFVPWIDKAQLLEKAGLRWDPVVSTGADLKMTGQGPSLLAAQREYIQRSLDATVGKFKSSVTAWRGRRGAEVNMNVLARGGMYAADEAKSLGLVDFVGDYSHVYDTLSGRAKRRK